MSKRYSVIIITILVCMQAFFVNAQSLKLEQLNIFDTREGAFTGDNSVNTYIIDIDESQILGIQVLPLTGNLIPEFKVFDAQGNEIDIIHDTYGNTQNTRVAFPESGQYRIVVSSASNAAGDYLINTKTLQPYTPNSLFISNDSTMSDVFTEDKLNRYWFATDPENVSTVIIYGENFEPGVVATMRNIEASQDVGILNSPATASVFCLPAGTDNYALEVMRDGESAIESYNVVVTSQSTTFCENAAITELAETLEQIDATSILDNGIGAIDATVDFTAETVNTIIQNNTSQTDNGSTIDTENIYNDLIAINVDLDGGNLSLDVLGNLLALNASLTDEGLNVDAEALYNDLIMLTVPVNTTLLNVDVLGSILDNNLIKDESGLILDVQVIFDDLLAVDTTLADKGLTVDTLSNILSIQTSLDDEGLTLDADSIFTHILSVTLDDEGLTVDVLNNTLSENLLGDGSTLDLDGVLNDLLLIDATLADDGLTVDVLSNIIDVNSTLSDDGLTLDAVSIFTDILSVTLGDDSLTVDVLNSSSSSNGVCSASAYDGSPEINIRSMPTITSSVVTAIETGETLDIVGQVREGTWMNVELLDGRTGYASVSVLDVASACVDVDIPIVWYDTETVLALEIAAGLVDAVDVQASAIVGSDGIIVNADGTIANIGDVNADVSVTDGGVNINVDTPITDTVDVNVDSGGVNVDAGGVDVNVDSGGVDVNVGGGNVNIGGGNDNGGSDDDGGSNDDDGGSGGGISINLGG